MRGTVIFDNVLGGGGGGGVGHCLVLETDILKLRDAPPGFGRHGKVVHL